MAPLFGDQRSTPVLLILLALGVGYMGYTGSGISLLGLKGITETRDSVAARKKTIATLQAQVDSAKKILQKESVEDIRRRVEGYRASLLLLRRLVPDRNEVPNLLDDISTRAKIRGVALSDVTPMAVEAGPAPFSTYKYRIAVLGHYDQIGEFLSDVASLQRIIVPIDLSVGAASTASAKALGDTTGSMLEAKFMIRTFVKPAEQEGEASGT